MNNTVSLLKQHSQYYGKRAASYASSEQMETEHEMTIAAMCGLAGAYRLSTFLDVGAGSGRGIRLVRNLLPSASVKGIEPVEELRNVAIGRGIPPEDIIKGSALELPFADSCFDCVYATGILHHISQPRVAISEMLRVAANMVVLSDTNNFGCGSFPQRLVANSLRVFGLWRYF